MFPSLAHVPRSTVVVGAALASAVMTSAFCVWRLQANCAEARTFMDESLGKERILSDWRAHTQVTVLRMTAMVESSDPKTSTSIAADIFRSMPEAARFRRDLQPLLREPEEIALYGKALARRQTYIAARDAVIAAKGENHAAQATSLFLADYRPVAFGYMDAVAELQAHERAAADARAAALSHRGATTMATIGALILALVALCVAGLPHVPAVRAIRPKDAR